MKRNTCKRNTDAEFVALCAPLMERLERTGEGATLAEIGLATGLTRMRIQQLEKVAIEKVRTALTRYESRPSRRNLT
jgi:hypothetical protein